MTKKQDPWLAEEQQGQQGQQKPARPAAPRRGGRRMGDEERRRLVRDGEAAAGRRYVIYAVHLSVSFFLVFTAFSAIQNIEASIVSGHCSHCTVYCDSTQQDCKDPKFSAGDVDDSSVTCSWTSNVTKKKYCANEGGDCKNSCPNKDDGSRVMVEGAYVDFDSCGSSTNVGSVAIGLLYATFTLCCLVGPYIVDVIRPKWAISLAFCFFAFFCAANVVVAKFPKSLALQWGLLVPASATVGFAASFLWTAQGTYLTDIAIRYASARGMENHLAALGMFNGIFWGFFQFTQISGNLAQSLLLNQAGWANTSLLLFYLVFAGGGTVLSLFMQGVDAEEEWEEHEAARSDAGDDDSERRTRSPARLSKTSVSARSRITSSVHSVAYGPQLNGTAVNTARSNKAFGESLRGVVTIWGDRRMMCLIPLIMYSGLEMGFIWGDFTTNWVKPSAGTSNIGYIMAAFGASDVLASLILGKISDRTGRTPIVCLGSAAHLGALITLYKIQVGQCDHKWALLIACACAWGIGDAAFNTQIGALLGEYFEDRKEDAFSNLKLWQSLMTSIAFFLNLSPDLMSSLGTLRLVLVFCCLGTAGFLAGVFFNWRERNAKVDERGEEFSA